MTQKWSKIRNTHEEDYLCEQLKGRVHYFATRYRSTHDRRGRVCILVDKVEKLNMSFEVEYEIWTEADHRRLDLEGRAGVNPQSLVDYYDDAAGDFHNKGIFEPWDFRQALNEYFASSIQDCLKSDNLLVRLLAFLDRRTGKRTLRRLRDEVDSLPEWLQYFYELRLESEGIQ